MAYLKKGTHFSKYRTILSDICESKTLSDIENITHTILYTTKQTEIQI